MGEADLAEVWARSLDELAEMHLEPAHRAWLQLTRPLGLVENTALIATPNEFVKEQLETRLRALITNTLSRELGRNIQLAVTVEPTAITTDVGHRSSGLRSMGGMRDESAIDADADTGPMQRIVDDGPAGADRFGDGARRARPGHMDHPDDLIPPNPPGGPAPIGLIPPPPHPTPNPPAPPPAP